MNTYYYGDAVYCDSILCPGNCDLCKTNNEENDAEEAKPA